MPTSDEWNSSSLIQCFEFLLEEIKLFTIHNLFTPDIGLLLSLFIGFLKQPRDVFHSSFLFPFHQQWGARHKQSLDWFQTKISTPPALFQLNPEAYTIWKEWPAHWRCFHVHLLYEYKYAKNERNKIKSGCKCAGKPKPPAFHHWNHQLILINAITNLMNQVFEPFMTFWKQVPLLPDTSPVITSVSCPESA